MESYCLKGRTFSSPKMKGVVGMDGNDHHGYTIPLHLEMVRMGAGIVAQWVKSQIMMSAFHTECWLGPVCSLLLTQLPTNMPADDGPSAFRPCEPRETWTKFLAPGVSLA